jgi:hypothetical protein
MGSTVNMGLETYRGLAARNYENSFFREFARNLSSMFDKYGWDGLLIGNSECTVESRLQIDALLITKHVVCIIDFKNYGGEINLPRIQDFHYGRWTTNNGDMIKGGSSINPYCQLNTQRKRFYETYKSYIEKKLPEGNYFNPSHTVRVVCFQNEIKLNGSIPPSDEVNFKIIESSNYLEKIKDILDINDREVNLTNESYSSFLKVFKAEYFDLTESYGKTPEYTPKSDSLNFESLREDQKAALSEFKAFSENPNEKVFILKGTANSGKTHLIRFFEDIAFDNGISQVELLAPTAKVANNLINNERPFTSLYSYIYGGNTNKEENQEEEGTDSKNESEISIVPLKTCDNEENTIFVVDESQLITDSLYQSIDLRFGTGHLLSDFIKFSNIKNTNRKIVFIGDCYQMTLGGDKNALSEKYIAKQFNVQIKGFHLDDNPNRDVILDNALLCVSGIRENLYNSLKFKFSKDFKYLEKIQVSTTIEQISSFKYICYTNEEAHKVNLWIKKSIIKNGSELSYGDLLLLNNTFSVEQVDYPYLEPQKLYNGQFLVLITAEDITEERIQLKNKTILLQFRELEVRKDNTTLRMLSLENYRNSPKGELSNEEIVGLKIILNRELIATIKKTPFEDSIHYKELMSSQEYNELKQEIVQLKEKLIQGDKVKTKLEKSESRLRVLEEAAKKRHKEEIENKLSRDSSCRYFKIKNHALVKYEWAMTVHKSMSYKFDNVILNVNNGQGKSNINYFRFIYTGITRATQKIYLVNYEEIYPTQNVKLIANSANSRNNKDFYLICDKEYQITEEDQRILKQIRAEESDFKQLAVQLYKLVESKLQTGNLSIISVEHPNYQQVYTFSDGKNEVKVRFYYNGKMQVKPPSIQSGTNDELNQITLDILTSNRKLTDYSFIKETWRKNIYEKINGGLLEKRLYIQSIVQNAWKDFVSISSENDEYLEVEVIYNGDGFITSIYAKQYSDEQLWQTFVSIVKEMNRVD